MQGGATNKEYNVYTLLRKEKRNMVGQLFPTEKATIPAMRTWVLFRFHGLPFSGQSGDWIPTHKQNTSGEWFSFVLLKSFPPEVQIYPP